MELTFASFLFVLRSQYRINNSDQIDQMAEVIRESKMKLNKKQVAVIWISVTVLIMVIYFAITAVMALHQKEALWLSVKPTEQALIERVNIIQERRAVYNKLGVFSFGWLSLTGLLVFLNNGKKA